VADLFVHNILIYISHTVRLSTSLHTHYYHIFHSTMIMSYLTTYRYYLYHRVYILSYNINIHVYDKDYTLRIQYTSDRTSVNMNELVYNKYHTTYTWCVSFHYPNLLLQSIITIWRSSYHNLIIWYIWYIYYIFDKIYCMTIDHYIVFLKT